jgi:arylsulfatase A-like enzyme
MVVVWQSAAGKIMIPSDTPTRRGFSGRAAIAGFVTSGATLGLALGFVEAGLLRTIPRFAGLTQPDVTGAIWTIAPLADAPVGALAGLLLGAVAVLPRRPRLLWRSIWKATGVGLAAAYLGWLLWWFRAGQGILAARPFPSLPPVFNWVFTPALYFAIAFAISIGFFQWSARRAEIPIGSRRQIAFRWLAGLDAALFTALLLALLAFRWRGPQFPPATSSQRAGGPHHNNVVLIMLDTVRADHLSCYGYARPTTPNLDRLASRGMLFENAIAPTSWTLPALASVLSGLLPHQHGADWYEPMSRAPMTLAEILKTAGFDTGGFNANPDFGLAGWGLAQGFDVYWDAHDWLRHNLVATFAGQSLYQTLFREFVSFNEFDRQDAGEVNQQVQEWLGQRSARPYFLFINYMDAHRPYVPPAPYDRRFGRLPKPLLWKISFSLHDGRWSQPITPAERRGMIDGYDNSLAYLDSQVGRLLDAMAASPDAGRTFVIVAGDHGEGFGEHGTFDHGWDLYREVLHVPLLVAGPGIPAGKRVAGVAELREVFPTVIQMALGNAGPPIARASLSRFWNGQSSPEAAAPPVVSELDLLTPAGHQSVLSLSAARWHFLVNSTGSVELYDDQADGKETRNLAASPDLQDVAPKLRMQLQTILAHSVSPWLNVNYLSALDRPGAPFVNLAVKNPEAFGPVGWPVGSSQAFFQSWAQEQTTRPTPSQEDLLRSLPYH